MLRLGFIAITTAFLMIISFSGVSNSVGIEATDSLEEEIVVNPIVYSIDEPAHNGLGFYYLKFNSPEQSVCNSLSLRPLRSVNENEGLKLLRIVKQLVVKCCLKKGDHFSFSDIFMHRNASSMHELYIYAFHKILI